MVPVMLLACCAAVACIFAALTLRHLRLHFAASHTRVLVLQAHSADCSAMPRVSLMVRQLGGAQCNKRHTAFVGSTGAAPFDALFNGPQQ